MSKFKKGDKVHGVNESAGIPRRGGIVTRVISCGYYYIDHVDGGGIGNRDEKELLNAS